MTGSQVKSIRRGTMAFMLAWGTAFSAQAAPLQYNISGSIGYNGGVYEDFKGSFMLSDPIVTIKDYNDSRGNRTSGFSITDFTLTSAHHSLYQIGRFSGVTLWWVDKPGQYYFSWLDSVVHLYTSGGSTWGGYDNGISAWNGNFDAHPTSFSFNNLIIGDGTRYRIIATAEVASLPVPAAAWLFGTGLLGLIGVARRKNAARF